jgi:hypothetical protein
MSRDSDFQSGIAEEKGAAPDFAERRRVIQGLASMPVLLTLTSGTARANASAFQCIGQTTPTLGPAAGVDVTCSDDESTPPTTPPNKDWVFSGPPEYMEKNKNRDGCYASSGPKYVWEWKYVCFDQNGQQATTAYYKVDSQGCTTGRPATMSCYASFL